MRVPEAHSRSRVIGLDASVAIAARVLLFVLRVINGGIRGRAVSGPIFRPPLLRKRLRQRFGRNAQPFALNAQFSQQHFLKPSFFGGF